MDISNKIMALQCSWVRRLYNNYFHEWKLIPLYLIEKPFDRSFKFHSNLLIKSNKKKTFSRHFFVLEKTSYYDDSNTFLYSVSISLIQWEYPDR